MTGLKLGAMMNSEERVRLQVEKHFRRPFSDSQWEFLVDKRYVEDIIAGEATAAEVAKEIKELMENLGTGPKGSLTGNSDLILKRNGPPAQNDRERRRNAISRLLALEATKEDLVDDFRDIYLTHLPDHLLAWEDMETWIEEQAAGMGEPTRYVEVPLPAGLTIRGDSARRAFLFDPELHVEAVPADWGVEVSVKHLKYGTPEGRYVQSVPVAAGSTLDILRRISERLARRFSWRPEQATVFVLTDEIPLFSLARMTRAYKATLPVTSRIEISVDPMVTAEELAEYYRPFRQRMMPGRRNRPLDAKHTELAVFAAGREADEPWQETVVTWNNVVGDAHEDWVYGEVQKPNFRRDIQQARERLLSPPYTDPVGHSGGSGPSEGKEVVDVVSRRDEEGAE